MSPKKRRRRPQRQQEEVVVATTKRQRPTPAPNSSQPARVPAAALDLGLEIAQLEAMREMAHAFQESTRALLKGRWQKHLASWLWRRRQMAAGTRPDARRVLFAPAVEPEGEPELVRKLALAAGAAMGKSKAEQEAREISMRLDKRMAELVEGIETRERERPNVARVRRRDGPGEETATLVAEDADGKELIALPITRTHLDDKLWGVWQARAEEPSRKLFNEHVLALLCRYLALQGGQLEVAGGNQCAVPAGVLSALREHCGVEGECFASAFNRQLPRFCSRFPDLERVFGSEGDFFETSFTCGSFEANPPFNPGFVAHMQAHMEAALAEADKRRDALQFVLILPMWATSRAVDCAAAWEALRASKFFNARHLELAHSRHAYLDGAQHYKPGAGRRVSSETTAVCFLQSRAARGKWPVTKKVVRSIEAAFTASV